MGIADWNPEWAWLLVDFFVGIGNARVLKKKKWMFQAIEICTGISWRAAQPAGSAGGSGWWW